MDSKKTKECNNIVSTHCVYIHHRTDPPQYTHMLVIYWCCHCICCHRYWYDSHCSTQQDTSSGIRVGGRNREYAHVEDRLDAPRELNGVLKENNRLTGSELLLADKLYGPECIAIDRRKEKLYTGLKTGYICEVDIKDGKVIDLNEMEISVYADGHREISEIEQ